MTGTYSPELVGLSLIVAVAASYVAFALAAHISDSKGWAAVYWLAGGAVAMGTGIWSMHFVGMLAFQLPIAMSYDIETTVASLLIAILVSGFALYIVSSRALGPWTLGIGAIAMGVGIALDALHRHGGDGDRAAAHLRHLARRRLDRHRHRCLRPWPCRWPSCCAATPWPTSCGSGCSAPSPWASASAPCTTSAWPAAQFAPGTICTAPGMQVDQQWLAIAVAASTFLFLGATMLILTIDVRLAHQLDEANARIAALAREDPLTGLANRRTFLEHLDAALRTRNRDKSELAVLFLDLDGFKDINDTLGHAAGDALLVEVAERLRKTVRQNDLVARFGGDEFAVLQTNIAGPADAGTLAEKIGTAIAEPLRHRPRRRRRHRQHRHRADDRGDQHRRPTSWCRPISRSIAPRTTAATAIASTTPTSTGRCTRACCWRASCRWPSRAASSSCSISRRSQIATGRIVGLEAHVRWNHPSRGIIKPSVFIPIAERTGTILAVGEWVLDEACRQLRLWQDHGLAPPILAIDVSGGQLKAAADIVADLKSVSRQARHRRRPHRAGVRASRCSCRPRSAMQSTLDALRELGFRICHQRVRRRLFLPRLSGATRRCSGLKLAALAGRRRAAQRSAARAPCAPACSSGASSAPMSSPTASRRRRRRHSCWPPAASRRQGPFFAPRLSAIGGDGAAEHARR